MPSKCVMCGREDRMIVREGMCRRCFDRPAEAKPSPVTMRRNARCYCGSGLKFKKCCLILVKHHANIRENGGF